VVVPHDGSFHHVIVTMASHGLPPLIQYTITRHSDCVPVKYLVTDVHTLVQNSRVTRLTPLRACSVSSQSMWIEWDWMSLNPKQVKRLKIFFSNPIQSMCIGTNRTRPKLDVPLASPPCYMFSPPLSTIIHPLECEFTRIPWK
jgi:hypothetical protein